MAAFIASPENIDHLDDIRQNNLRLAGMLSGTPVNTATPVVWLSYNVHGNEPASSEAAMQALFELVNPANTQTKQWLKNVVVVIDPCLNPDGRERYINNYNSVRGVVPDADPASREHTEPWPGGRLNHYYFDLNRDWAWQTQRETQYRLSLFSQWLPQIHVDFHEQGIDENYFFPPAATPMHQYITAWQRQFQTVIGKNNARYFDQNGWLYYTREVYDFLYPSYGDTYPTYNGSIGLTYEQAGIRAGLAVQTQTGDTLTLADRIAHHLSNSLSTIETASANAQKLVDEFKTFYANSTLNPPGEYKGYVVKNDNPDKIAALAKLLDNNGIRYGFGLSAPASGYNYFGGKTEAFDIKPADMVIDAHQPKAVLLTVLFEPKTYLADSATYDITAWALPYAYGLQTYGLKQSIKVAAQTFNQTPIINQPDAKAFAYICNWKSKDDAAFLAALIKYNVKVRFNQTAFEAAGVKFAPGTLIIARAGNNFPGFDHLVVYIANQFNRKLTKLASGMVDSGADVGSLSTKYIVKPKVLLVSGDGITAERMGEVWHFFEQQLAYPITVVSLHNLANIKLADYNELILPDGNYTDLPLDKLLTWVNDGGKLIAMENAASALAGKKGFNLKGKDNAHTETKTEPVADVKQYGNRDRDALATSIPGAIYKVDLDITHPLAFGLASPYYCLKLNDQLYEKLTDDDWNVGTINKAAWVAGFVGVKTKAKLKDGLLIGVQTEGSGSIIYLADDPLFRSFWENGKLLYCNAVFF